MGSQEQLKDVVFPSAEVAQTIHRLRLPKSSCLESSERERALIDLQDAIKKHEMLPLYETLNSEFGLKIDDIDKIKEANEKELNELNQTFQIAQDQQGDVEVKDCLLNKANYYCRIGAFEEAIKAYETAADKTVGAGSKMDITLTLIRLGILCGIPKLAEKSIEKAKADSATGADWERRNKLKLFEGLFLAQKRKFPQAAALLLDCTAVFMGSEVATFEQFIFVTIVLSMACIGRPELKKRVLESPEVSQVLQEDIVLKEFLHSFYYCQYSVFMKRLVDVAKRISIDFFLFKHLSFLVRAIRLKAYQQFLTPFRSITLASMAQIFECPAEFLEEDVADYVTNGKLDCQIDKVDQVIWCLRKNPKKEYYIKAIQQGDLLLSKRFIISAPPDRFSRDFFLRSDPCQIAKDLLGCLLWSASKTDSKLLVGQITEVEAYIGPDDKASHAYNNKCTKRNAIMFGNGGYAYVYTCYGIHKMINIVTNTIKIPHAILIRAIRPIAGLPLDGRGSQLSGRGPGCLTKILQITSDDNGEDLVDGNRLWISAKPDLQSFHQFVLKERSKVDIPLDLIKTTWPGLCNPLPIGVSSRIGVDYAGADALLPYRFFIAGEPSVSRMPPKKRKNSQIDSTGQGEEIGQVKKSARVKKRLKKKRDFDSDD